MSLLHPDLSHADIDALYADHMRKLQPADQRVADRRQATSDLIRECDRRGLLDRREG